MLCFVKPTFVGEALTKRNLRSVMKQVVLYTDGACSGNPGPGGYGAVLCYKEHRLELSGGYVRTTNNRMELTAAIVGLQALKEACEVTLYSDSKYLVDALRLGWLESWKRRGFRKADGSAVVNPDLWRALDAELARHRVEPVWVKGHADNALNNRCDELAVAAAAAAVRPDPGYREKEED